MLGALLLFFTSEWAGVAVDGGMEIFYMVAAANGLHNSITSSLTGNLIRSGHYSGMTSDSGTFLGQMLRGEYANSFQLTVNTALCLAFWCGGYVSFGAMQDFAPATLMFSAILFALIGLGAIAVRLD